MSAALKWNLLSEQDYLAMELASPIKHEYVGGVLHAMAGVRIIHDVIGGNIIGELHGRLRGKPCRPHTSDMKIRIQLPGQVRFYYPDASVICRSNPLGKTYQEEPVVIFEVLSKSTRRADLGEKKDAYLSIPSLRVYVLVEQNSPVVVAYRRTADAEPTAVAPGVPSGFVREVYEGLDAVLPLKEIGVELPLAEIYHGAELVEPENDEEDLR